MANRTGDSFSHSLASMMLTVPKSYSLLYLNASPITRKSNVRTPPGNFRKPPELYFMKTVTRIACACAVLAIVHAAHANLVSNPDFADGFADWTGVNSAGFTSDPVVADQVGDNITAWHEGAVGYDRYEEQDLTTTVGDEYQISFWLQPEEGVVSDYTALWGGATVFDWTQTNSGVSTAGVWSDYDAFGLPILFSPAPAWNQIVIDVTATSVTELLQLGIRQDPSYSNLTEVDVEDLGPVNSAPDGGLGLLVIAATLAGVCGLSSRSVRQRVL
jgi:hypothetical protein